MTDKGMLAQLFSRTAAKLVAHWYLKRPEFEEKIQEKYQIPSTILAAFLNLLYFHCHSTWSYRVAGIVLEPTNVCNLNCSICYFEKTMIRKKGYMKLDLVRKILKENPRVESYTLPFLGEPFLHKELSEIVRLISIPMAPSSKMKSSLKSLGQVSIP